MAEDRQARLERELEKIEDALDRARLDKDPSLIETQMEIAGLTANYWLICKRMAKRGSAHEFDCDRHHNEAQTQFARLASKRKDDLLPKVIARLDELSGDEDALQAMARRRAVA